MEKTYNGRFYVVFGENEENQLIFHYNSRYGLRPDFGEGSYEKIDAIISNVAARTNLGGVIAYSPVGPFLEFNPSDPRVVYLALRLTYPDALSISYLGLLENREELEEFISTIEAPPVDKDGFPVVR